MKVLISASGSDLTSPVDPRFGRAPYFVIVDTSDPQNFRALPNPNTAAPSGAGIASAQLAIQERVQAVISGAIGPNASSVLASAGITTYVAPAGITVKEAVDLLIKGQLSPAAPTQNPGTPPGPGFNPGMGPGPGFGSGPGWGGGFGPGRGWGGGRGGRGRGGRGGGWGKGKGRGWGGGRGGWGGSFW